MNWLKHVYLEVPDDTLRSIIAGALVGAGYIVSEAHTRPLYESGWAHTLVIETPMYPPPDFGGNKPKRNILFDPSKVIDVPVLDNTGHL